MCVALFLQPPFSHISPSTTFGPFFVTASHLLSLPQKVKVHFVADADDVSYNYAPMGKEGEAKATYVTGVEAQVDTYDGNFTNGMRDGQGSYAWGNPNAKGAYYKGQFKGHDAQPPAAPAAEEGAEPVDPPPFTPYHGGLPHGEGVHVYPDGSHYVGT